MIPERTSRRSGILHSKPGELEAATATTPGVTDLPGHTAPSQNTYQVSERRKTSAEARIDHMMRPQIFGDSAALGTSGQGPAGQRPHKSTMAKDSGRLYLWGRQHAQSEDGLMSRGNRRRLFSARREMTDTRMSVYLIQHGQAMP